MPLLIILGFFRFIAKVMFMPHLNNFNYMLNGFLIAKLKLFNPIRVVSITLSKNSSNLMASTIASLVLTLVNKTVLLKESTVTLLKLALPCYHMLIYLLNIGMMHFLLLAISSTDSPLLSLITPLRIKLFFTLHQIILSSKCSDVLVGQIFDPTTPINSNLVPFVVFS